MDILLGNNYTFALPPFPAKRENVEFILPEKNRTTTRAVSYLENKRGIPHEVLNAFIASNMIYESYPYHNVVFVGYDHLGKPAHANLRGTGKNSAFKGNASNSDPRYSFHWKGNSHKLYVFEAPIDMLSFIALHKDGWRWQHYVACCGVSEQPVLEMIRQNNAISLVILCFDNDDAGHEASSRFKDHLEERGISVVTMFPNAKDWNEDLLQNKQALEESKCRNTPG